MYKGVNRYEKFLFLNYSSNIFPLLSTHRFLKLYARNAMNLRCLQTLPRKVLLLWQFNANYFRFNYNFWIILHNIQISRNISSYKYSNTLLVISTKSFAIKNTFNNLCWALIAHALVKLLRSVWFKTGLSWVCRKLGS